MRGESTGGVAAPGGHSSAHGQDHFFTVNFAELKTGELRYQMIGIVGSVRRPPAPDMGVLVHGVLWLLTWGYSWVLGVLTWQGHNPTLSRCHLSPLASPLITTRSAGAVGSGKTVECESRIAMMTMV